jgi:polar amino acid transport system substrate-binding protein
MRGDIIAERAKENIHVKGSQRNLIGRRLSRLAGAVGIAASVALLAACGGGGSTSTGGGPSVTCPSSSTVATWHLANPGQLTIVTDNTYAPAEYVDTSGNQFTGYDMDLAREFARRLCLTPNIVKSKFDDIIPAISGPSLGQQRYDMSISSFTITDERKGKVDMIPYFQAGESILTLTANPKNIKSINDMCGNTVAVQNGTVEKDELADANGNGPGTSGQTAVCKSKPITIISNDDQTVVVQNVLNGRADASYQDQPVTDYYVKQNSGKLIDSGINVAPSPQGIVVRKDNAAFEKAITDALSAMRTDGTYLKILKDWGVDKLAYPTL